MLEVQKYLMNNSLESLNKELGIVSNKHPELPLVILNYDQIESPKTNPIVRECRGLVLNSNDYSLAAMCMPRFFNVGEVADEFPLFDFSDFITHEKVDGSLVTLFHFQNNWMAKTRGSWGLDSMQGLDFNWLTGILKALNSSSFNDLNLDPNLTYVTEFCSLWNKVVREYRTPCVYSLTAFDGEKELHWEDIPKHSCFQYPQTYHLKSVDDMKEYLLEKSKTDATFEGFVIRDKDSRRWKLKSETYLSLHRLKGNDNLFLPKNLLPFVLAGELDEVVLYFPEVKDKAENMLKIVNAEKQKLMEVWNDAKNIESQKDFAIYITNKTPFSSILFAARKNNTKPDKLFLQANDLILRKLFQ